MSISIFEDPKRRPSMEEVLAAVGSKRSDWEELVRFMAETYGVAGELHCYGQKSGWMVWFRKSGRTIVSLYPRADGFAAQLLLGPTQYEPAMALSLGERARRALESAVVYPEGRLLLLPVESEEDMRDLRQLVMVKARPPRRKSASSTAL